MWDKGLGKHCTMKTTNSSCLAIAILVQNLDDPELLVLGFKKDRGKDVELRQLPVEPEPPKKIIKFSPPLWKQRPLQKREEALEALPGFALHPLRGYQDSTRRRKRIPKTNSIHISSEDELLPEDDLPPENKDEDACHEDELPREDESPPEDAFRRHIPRKRVTPRRRITSRRRIPKTHSTKTSYPAKTNHLPKTHSEDTFHEDELPREDESPPEDAFRRHIPRRRTLKQKDRLFF